MKEQKEQLEQKEKPQTPIKQVKDEKATAPQPPVQKKDNKQNNNDAPSDAELYVKRTINIPASYERKKVWIGIHHYNSTDVAKSLFFEEFKLY